MGLFGKNKKTSGETSGLFNRLARVDHTYSQMPPKMVLEVDQITRGLINYGRRRLSRKGPGTDFFEARDFNPQTDEPRHINARLSAKTGKFMVVDKEADVPQHFFLWRDASPSMDYRSDKNRVPFTKKESAEIMLLALAKYMARNEELVGILDGHKQYRGARTVKSISSDMSKVSVVTGDTAHPARKLPNHSTVILFSDFLGDKDEIADMLSTMNGSGLRGYMVMVLDPQELEFNYKGRVELEGLEGEGLMDIKKAESIREKYLKEINTRIEDVRHMARRKGFKFIIQRTDEPLSNSILEMYGLRQGGYRPPTGPKNGV